MKNTIRLISHILRRRKRKQPLGDKPLCYSEGGFLTDLLEQNGFCVTKMEWQGNSFSFVVTLMTDKKVFEARLKKIAKTHVINF